MIDAFYLQMEDFASHADVPETAAAAATENAFLHVSLDFMPGYG